MPLLVILLTVGAVIAAVMLGLRKVILDEGKLERQMSGPGTHTLEVDVPNGMDPVAMEVALHHAHFTAVTRHDGGTERVAIACDERDRAHVRDVLEHVHAPSAAGPDQYLGHVQFRDEIVGTPVLQESDVEPSVATVAEEPFARDVNKHEKRYLISMGIRTVCFIAAGLSIGHWFVWLFVLGALVLPYFAVVEAN